MGFDLIFGHTSFLGHTGYNHHAREFFTELNKYIPVRIRNFSHSSNIDYLTQEQKDMIVYQTWSEPPFEVGKPFNIDPDDRIVNIILNETNHYFFYHDYKGLKIAYNVWESTRQPEHFFKKLLEFDQLWVPTKWQRDCSIEQGFPADRVKIVPEGINAHKFCPGESLLNPYPDNGRFRFIVFGRWDRRKSTTEIIRSFLEEFKKDEPVDLYIHVDNPWGYMFDNMNSTEERLQYYGFIDERIKILHDLEKVENDDLYISYLRNAHCFVSCARAEGWNLPLAQAIAVGTPSICSNYGAQLDFADGTSHLVNIEKYVTSSNIFMQDDVPGVMAEPDFNHLKYIMRDIYNNYEKYKQHALLRSNIIRQEFTWENAAKKALTYLDELYKSKYGKDPVKVNLGCGVFKKKRYINIDKYVTADIYMDMLNLAFEDSSVDEIYTSHALEHFTISEASRVLDECYRVLKDNGVLEIEVPDFEYVINEFLKKERWELIFGSQDHAGEYHKTGFTRTRLRKVLNDAGFYVDKIEDIWSHDQNSLVTRAVKKNILDDSIFVIDAYSNTEYKQKLLEEQINKLRKYNRPIMIVSHYQLPEKIFNLADYILYDKENTIVDYALDYWYQILNHIKIVGKVNKGYHCLAVHSSLKNALNFCQNRFKYMHFIEFDLDADFDRYLNKINKLMQSKKFVGFLYDEEQNIGNHEITYGIIPNLFTADVNWLNEKLVDVRSWDKYVELSAAFAEKTKRSNDYIYENWLYNYFVANDMINDTKLFDKDEKYEVIKELNLITAGDIKQEDYKLLLSETDDHQIVVFLINESNVKDLTFSYYVNGKRQVENGFVVPKGYLFRILPKEGTIKFIINNQREEIINIDQSKIYNETRFRFYDDRVKCILWNEEDNADFIENTNLTEKIQLNYNFLDGAFLEILGTTNNKFKVEFIDQDTNRIIYSSEITPNHWARPNPKYFVNWKICVKNHKDELIFEHRLNLTNQRVYINLDSSAMGDTLAWFPYVEEFRKKHNCKIIVSTFWNQFFKETYPEIEFVEPGTTVLDLYAQYKIGCFDDDYNRNKIHWRTVPLQKVAADILGLEYEEIRPIITEKVKEPIIEGDKYIAISQYSTFQAKFWMYPKGWQTIVDYLNGLGYKVVVVSLQEPLDVINIIDKTGKKQTIFDTINIIKHSKAFIGVSTGLSWLAWALKVPTILISGYSMEWAEMKDCIRVLDKTKCHGCFNDVNLPIDRGNWNWCPRNKDFECSKLITPNMVIESIKKVLNNE